MEEGKKEWSFPHEDSNYRSVFLRSYPLQWEQVNSNEEEEFKASIKNRFTDIFHWGEDKVLMLRKIGEDKVLQLRRIKNKAAFSIFECHPFGFRSANRMIVV